MNENKKLDRSNLMAIIYIMVVVIAGVSVAYAALSTTWSISTTQITQSSLSWNVGFTPGNVTPTETGSSGSGRVCGSATVTASTVTVANTTLSKPEDGCTYALTVANTGSIDATLATITAVSPTSTSCTTNTDSSMTCGNITYSLTSDSTGNTLLTTGGTLAKTSGTQNVYLNVKYTGSGLQTSEVTQSNGGFTLIYNQK